jgi:hypothetical protein
MGLGPRLELRQSQQLVMTPQLQLAIKLLTLTNVELEGWIAEELERMSRANQELDQKARNFHEQLKTFRERDKALNEALVSAQQLRGEIKEQAEREAQLILREAQAQADKLLQTVRDELRPDGDIEITVTGLRPGEKLYEELLIGDNPKPTQHARIMKAHEQFLSWPQLEQKLNALSIAMSVNDVPVIRGQLQELVSGYVPSGEVVDWVHMALEREALANE